MCRLRVKGAIKTIVDHRTKILGKPLKKNRCRASSLPPPSMFMTVVTAMLGAGGSLGSFIFLLSFPLNEYQPSLTFDFNDGES